MTALISVHYACRRIAMDAIDMCSGVQRAISSLSRCHNHRGISPSRASENAMAPSPKSKRRLGVSFLTYGCGVEFEMGDTMRGAIAVGTEDSRSLRWLSFFAFDCARGKLILGIIAPVDSSLRHHA